LSEGGLTNGAIMMLDVLDVKGIEQRESVNGIVQNYPT
jgi:hypothetical protein